MNHIISTENPFTNTAIIGNNGHYLTFLSCFWSILSQENVAKKLLITSSSVVHWRNHI